MEPRLYPIPPGRAREVLSRIRDYGVLRVEVENLASLFDDMLASDDARLKYALERLDDGNIDRAVLVVKGETAVLVIKMETIMEIRVALRDYERLLKDLGL